MLHYKAEMCISVIAAWSNANHCTALLIEQNKVFVTKIQNWCHKCTLQHYCVLAKTDYIKTRNLTMELLEFLMVCGHFFSSIYNVFQPETKLKEGRKLHYITCLHAFKNSCCMPKWCSSEGTVIWLKSFSMNDWTIAWQRKCTVCYMFYFQFCMPQFFPLT